MGTYTISLHPSPTLPILRLLDLNWIPPLAFLVLSQSRSWDLATSITEWANSYKKSLLSYLCICLFVSCQFYFSGELWLIWYLKHFCYIPKYDGYLRKGTHETELQVKLATCFMESCCYYYLKEQLKDKLPFNN